MEMGNGNGNQELGTRDLGKCLLKLEYVLSACLSVFLYVCM